jgi:hypothetical protein
MGFSKKKVGTDLQHKWLVSGFGAQQSIQGIRLDQFP